MFRAPQELQAANPTRGPMTPLLARSENGTAFRCHLFAQLLCRDRLRRTEWTDHARLRFFRIAHVKIEKLLPLGEIVAGYGVRVLGVELFKYPRRNDNLGVERPWSGQFLRP